jgi:membrane protease YdiL (CAAX protease family)
MWAADRMGIEWSEGGTASTGQAIARRCALGAGTGIALAFACATAAVVAGTAHVVCVGPNIEDVGTAFPLVLGLLAAALGCVRDELVLRGAAMQIARDRLPAWGALVLAIAVAVAASAGTDPGRGVLALRAAVEAALFATMWQRGRGAWVPVSAHVALRFVEGPLERGGLVDLRFRGESTGDLPSLLVMTAAAVFAAVGTVWTTAASASARRARSPGALGSAAKAE